MHQENKIITIEEISKVNLCVGRIVSAEQIPNKQKILKAVVDIGSELRDVVIGAAEYYRPEALIGKVVVVCTNLAPKKFGTITSNGMLLAAECPDGKPIFLTIDGEVPIGAPIR
jgi:methionine--tRNA ligase beta chain